MVSLSNHLLRGNDKKVIILSLSCGSRVKQVRPANNRILSPEVKSHNIFEVIKPHLLVGKFKARHNPVKLFSVCLIEVGAVTGGLDAFSHPAGKHQAGGAAAFPAKDTTLAKYPESAVMSKMDPS